MCYFFQTETEELVYSGRYDGREDFSVVLQPFLKNTIVPLNTVSYWSPPPHVYAGKHVLALEQFLQTLMLYYFFSRMATLTPPTSLRTVSTSVNGDMLTWL